MEAATTDERFSDLPVRLVPGALVLEGEESEDGGGPELYPEPTPELSWARLVLNFEPSPRTPVWRELFHEALTGLAAGDESRGVIRRPTLMVSTWSDPPPYYIVSICRHEADKAVALIAQAADVANSACADAEARHLDDEQRKDAENRERWEARHRAEQELLADAQTAVNRAFPTEEDPGSATAPRLV